MNTATLERTMAGIGTKDGATATVDALKTIARNPNGADIGNIANAQPGRERTVSLG